MMIFVGLGLIVPIVLIIRKAIDFKTSRKDKLLLDLLLFLISVLFIIIIYIIPMEPIIIKITEPLDYILYSGLIYLFTPFMWIITIYYSRGIFKKIKVRKNARLKGSIDYYRDDLDKISPNIIMFTSTYDVDYKKSIASTILKLKLIGYIREKRNKFEITDKDPSELLDSEKMVLNLIKTGDLDKSNYKKIVEKEVISKKYVKKNSNVIVTLIKIVLVILTNIYMYKASIALDDYVYENYHIITEERDNKRYIKLGKEEDIEKLYNKVKNESVYYGEMFDYRDGRRMSYSYNMIRSNALQYSVVRKAVLLNILVPVSIVVCFISSFVVLYIIVDLLININKKYRRTLKGKELLNKAYGLKNFLEDFSLIKNRKEKELILWEYYLIYSSILGVNVKINDEVINKYVK